VELDDVVLRFVPRLLRAMRHQRIVEAFRRCLIEAVKEVAIPVKGDLDRGVPEAGLDDLGVLPLGYVSPTEATPTGSAYRHIWVPVLRLARCSR
jgi:hypothetical protein